MEPLNKAFVIVETYANSILFIKDHISFNKEELDVKCAELNEEKNAAWKASYEKANKNRGKKKELQPYQPSIIYMVTNLADAIEKLTDMVYEENTIHDENY